MRRLVRSCRRIIAVAAVLGACRDAAGPSPPSCTPDCPLPTPPFDAIEAVELQTYDGSGQVVHPDVAATMGFARYPLWLAITPYPAGNAAYENPSLYRSLNHQFWGPPSGLINPVVRPAGGYLSDPDLVFDAARQRLWLYYRQVVGGKNVVLLTRSDNGVTWDAPVEIVSAPSHQIISPAVVRGAPGAPWLMWAVNSGASGCLAASTSVERRTSTDGVHWSAATATDLAQPGQVIWHLDVQWIPAWDEYWAIYNTYREGGTCVTGALYLARSADGIHWTSYPAPVLARGVTAAFRDVIYRSTFAVDGDGESVAFWFSGARYEGGAYEWRAATQVRRVVDLLTAVEQPPLEQIPDAAPNLPPPEMADMPAQP